MTKPQKIQVVGASIARPLLTGGAIRIGASNSRFYRRPTVNIGSVLYFTRALFPCRCGILYKRFCASPTGGNGNNLFCTRVLFHIAANFHRRTSDARPYGWVIKNRLFIWKMAIYRLPPKHIIGQSQNKCVRSQRGLLSGSRRRTSDARPYNEGMFLKYAALSLLLSGAIRFFHKKEKYGGIFAVFYW